MKNPPYFNSENKNHKFIFNISPDTMGGAAEALKTIEKTPEEIAAAEARIKNAEKKSKFLHTVNGTINECATEELSADMDQLIASQITPAEMMNRCDSAENLETNIAAQVNLKEIKSTSRKDLLAYINACVEKIKGFPSPSTSNRG